MQQELKDQLEDKFEDNTPRQMFAANFDQYRQEWSQLSDEQRNIYIEKSVANYELFDFETARPTKHIMIEPIDDIVMMLKSGFDPDALTDRERSIVITHLGIDYLDQFRITDRLIHKN